MKGDMNEEEIHSFNEFLKNYARFKANSVLSQMVPITFATNQRNNNVETSSDSEETEDSNNLSSISSLSCCNIRNNNKDIRNEIINNSINHKKREQYPDGDIEFSIQKSVFEHLRSKPPSFGWKFMTFNTAKLKGGYKTIYKVCLGVYKCPHCDFKQPPLQPIKKSKNVLPKRPKTKCPKHGELEYISCDSRCQITEFLTYWKVKHLGFHNHSLLL